MSSNPNLVPQEHGGALGPAWQPGVSPNPGGRPKTKPITEAYTRILDLSPEDFAEFKPRTMAEMRAYEMVECSPGRVLAMKEIADRVEGKAVDTIVMQGNLGELAAAAARRGEDE